MFSVQIVWADFVSSPLWEHTPLHQQRDIPRRPCIQHMQGALQSVLWNLQMTSSGKPYGMILVVVYTGIGDESGDGEGETSTAEWKLTSVLS